MDDSTTEKQAMYKSIADCDICNRIPQKVAEDIVISPKIIPPEVNRLLTVIEMEDESTHAYCTSITRLLKCPVCGTHYYYSWDHQERDTCTLESTDITVRRSGRGCAPNRWRRAAEVI